VTGLDGVAPTCRQKSCQHLFKERFTRLSSLVPHEIQISPYELFQCPGLVRKARQVVPFSFFIPPLVCAESKGWSSFGVRACYAHGRAEISGSRTRNGEFSLTLQEGSVGVDELVRLDITNRDTGHVGGICRVIGVVGVEDALVRSKSRGRPNVSAQLRYPRFPCAAARLSATRALGSTFRRSRDLACSSAHLPNFSNGYLRRVACKSSE
jgi:hypothetical protein